MTGDPPGFVLVCIPCRDIREPSPEDRQTSSAECPNGHTMDRAPVIEPGD